MEYDVIVVGADSTGSVVASRLAEYSNRSVLLLEAGPDYPGLEHLPTAIRDGGSVTGEAVDSPRSWSLRGTITEIIEECGLEIRLLGLGIGDSDMETLLDNIRWDRFGVLPRPLDWENTRAML